METKEENKHDLTSDEALDNFIDPDIQILATRMPKMMVWHLLAGRVAINTLSVTLGKIEGLILSFQTKGAVTRVQASLLVGLALRSALEVSQRTLHVFLLRIDCVVIISRHNTDPRFIPPMVHIRRDDGEESK